jgi:hypothetical protein
MDHDLSYRDPRLSDPRQPVLHDAGLWDSKIGDGDSNELQPERSCCFRFGHEFEFGLFGSGEARRHCPDAMTVDTGEVVPKPVSAPGTRGYRNAVVDPKELHWPPE